MLVFFEIQLRIFVNFFYGLVNYVKQSDESYFLEECFDFTQRFVVDCVKKVKVSFFQKIFDEIDYNDFDSNIIKIINKKYIDYCNRNMQVKFYINRLESILKQKYPEMNAEIYYSRRKKLVHLALDKSIEQFRNYNDFLNEIEAFFEIYFKKEFEFCKPIRIIHTIKWKFDYVIFRKRTSN